MKTIAHAFVSRGEERDAFGCGFWDPETGKHCSRPRSEHSVPDDLVRRYTDQTIAWVRELLIHQATDIAEHVDLFRRRVERGEVPTNSGALQRAVGDLLWLQGKLEVLTEVDGLAPKKGGA